MMVGEECIRFRDLPDWTGWCPSGLWLGSIKRRAQPAGMNQRILGIMLELKCAANSKPGSRTGKAIYPATTVSEGEIGWVLWLDGSLAWGTCRGGVYPKGLRW
jgi:hypothetical protein